VNGEKSVHSSLFTIDNFFLFFMTENGILHLAVYTFVIPAKSMPE